MDRLYLVPTTSPRPAADAPASDEALVRALRDGEPWARRELVNRHGPHLRRLIIRLIGDDADRADVLQETFIRAFGSLDKLEEPAALRAWLIRVGVFVAREHLRRKRRRRWLAFLAEPPEPSAPVASDGVREAARCVYEVLDTMPVEERTVFVLHLFEGFELQDLVDVLGLSYATIRRRFAHAQKLFDKKSARYEALAPWREGAR